ncbi:ArsC family reductase [Variovorax sp. dw_308]|uniref:ArsC family reductase n=1 Tax=Variovorax sp. dw_308 TaxID=2721546 RepID=UPI001C43D9E4|nr:ArsC family reductase [Variovorax sp. dw_308]
MTTTLFGIPNCDTVKRARTWLDTQGVPYTFHDFRKNGLPGASLDRWLRAPGWEALLNRRGTTWRRLDEATRASVVDAASARTVLVANPTLIKRPVVEWQPASVVTVGFDPAEWAAHAAGKATR